MEKRLYARLATSIEVQLHYKNFPLVRYSTHDVSPNGMFVETQANIYLKKFTPLRIEFATEQNNTFDHFILPATIVRISPQGIGLKFNRTDNFIFTYFHQMLARKCLDEQPWLSLAS